MNFRSVKKKPVKENKNDSGENPIKHICVLCEDHDMSQSKHNRIPEGWR